MPIYRLLPAKALLLLFTVIGFSGLVSAHAEVTVSSTQLEKAVSEYVEEALQQHLSGKADTQASVELLKIPNINLKFPLGKKATIQPNSNLSNVYSERSVVQVTITTDAGEVRTLGVPVKISIQKMVWVAKHIIPAKSPLNPSDFILQSRQVSQQFSHVVGRECSLKDYLARVNLQAGEVLDDRKIIIPPDITRNSEINIILTNGNGMNVAVSGLALADGRIGQTIRVKQTVYNLRYFNAKVVDKNRVLVEI